MIHTHFLLRVYLIDNIDQHNLQTNSNRLEKIIDECEQSPRLQFIDSDNEFQLEHSKI